MSWDSIVDFLNIIVMAFLGSPIEKGTCQEKKHSVSKKKRFLGRTMRLRDWAAL
jgi:hypothetical protein